MDFTALTPPLRLSYPAYTGSATSRDPVLARNPHLSSPLVLPGLHELAARAQKAADDERKYEEIQRAKFKSVEQGMDYEGFQNMVRGAHLTPINFSASPLSALYETATQKQRQGTITAEFGLDCGSVTTVSEGVGDITAAPVRVTGHLAAKHTPANNNTTTHTAALFLPLPPSSVLSLASILETDRAERASAVGYTTAQPYLPDTNVLMHISATRPDAAHLRDGEGKGGSMSDEVVSRVGVAGEAVGAMSAPAWMLDASVAAGSRVKSLHDLEREWRNIPDTGKILVLCGIPKDQFPEVFSVSLGFDTVSTVCNVMGKAAGILSQHPLSSDATCASLENIPVAHIVQQLYYMLHHLSTSPRISLTTTFLSEQDQSYLTDVGKIIKDWLRQGGEAIIQQHKSESATVKDEMKDEDDASADKTKKKKTTKKSGVKSSLQYDMMLPGWDSDTLALIASDSVTGDVDISGNRFDGLIDGKNRSLPMEDDMIIGGRSAGDAAAREGAPEKAKKKKSKSDKSKGAWASVEGVDAALKVLGCRMVVSSQ